MTPTRPDAENALRCAYEDLSEAGENVTVRTLRDRAKVDNNTAAAWLKARRAADKLPSPVPDDVAAAMAEVFRGQIVEPIWSRCTEQADADVKQRHAEELLTARDAAESAQKEAERSTARAEALQVKHDQTAKELTEAQRTLKDLRAAQNHWLRDTDQAREEAAAARVRAEEASAAQLRAETELATLREVLATIRPGKDGS